MALRHIRAFKADMDIVVKRVGKQLKVTVTDKGKLVVAKDWNGKEVIRVVLRD